MVPRTRDRDRPTDGDDTDDAEAPSDDAEEQDDPTPDLSERDRTIEDLAADDGTNVRQQVVSGSRANFELDPKFNPGFTDTEVVNRIGMVLSLNCSYDYNRGVWVGDPIDKSERQAVEQTLAEDRATEDLTDSVNTDESTGTNTDGDLQLQTEERTFESFPVSGPSEATAIASTGFIYEPDSQITRIRLQTDAVDDPPDTVDVLEYPDENLIHTTSYAAPELEINVTLEAGQQYLIAWEYDGGSWDTVDRVIDTVPFGTSGGTVINGWQENGGQVEELGNATDLKADNVPETGEATSSFDNPCKATSTRSAQHDVCSRSGDVQVDLYNGDPDDPDSTLLAKDIDQREDISDLPDAFSDLQYRIRLTRAPDGSSPKVSRLGHQIIR